MNSGMHCGHRLLYKGIHALSRRMAAHGTSGLRALARALGTVLWLVLPGRRALATRTIMERLELPESRARDIARQSFTHNALSFLEITMSPEFSFTRPDLRVDRPDMLEKLRNCDRPLIVTTAHLGAWEFCAGLAGDFKPHLPRMAVVRNHGNQAVRQYMFDMRSGRGSQVIGHRNAAFSALKTLRRNGLVGFLADHNARSDEAIFLPFLGRVAAVNVGPAVLSVRAQALVWPVVVIRESENYVLLLHDVLDTAELIGTMDEKIKATAAFYTSALENWIRQYPEQWFWMHKRWKTRPPDEI